jgi:hypothetical protein
MAGPITSQLPRTMATLAQMRRDSGIPDAPECSTCKKADRVRLTDGREVYRHRPDLHRKAIWKCDGCQGYVGCHEGGAKPLGTPAGVVLRQARSTLHDRCVDPIWKNAAACPAYADKRKDLNAVADITRAARGRTYDYLAHHMNLTREQCHIGMFDLDQCRQAWKILFGIKYEKIRDWAHTRRANP